MADYRCAIRTNHFRVTDVEKFKLLCSRIKGEGFTSWSEQDRIGITRCGFGAHGELSWNYYPDLKTFEKECNPDGKKLCVSVMTEEQKTVDIPWNEAVKDPELFVTDFLEDGNKIMVTVSKDERDQSSEGEIFTIVKHLQKLIPDKEAAIIMETGNEALRYLVGHATIITSTEIAHVDLHDAVNEKARELLGVRFTTKFDY